MSARPPAAPVDRRRGARGPLIAAGALLLAAACLLIARPTLAFSISNGGTRGCHEEITALAFQDFLLYLPFPGFTPPEDGVWRAVADFTLQYFDVDPDTLTDKQKFVLVSLVVGVRSPDTDGHSATNLSNLRRLHGDKSDRGQYLHALRGIDDDGRAGDIKAVEGIREAIREAVADAFGVAEGRASREVLIKAPFYLDFYGRFEITVLAPAFHLGRAAHVMQDSFSHAIRSEAHELRQVATVFNYVDAITYGFERSRDGLPHSDSLDNCSQSTGLFNAAVLATIDLFLAARELASGRDPAALEDVLDGWLRVAEECVAENGYCGSEAWVALAEEAETEPYLEAIFGCRSVLGEPGAPPPLAVGLLLALWFGWRPRRHER